MAGWLMRKGQDARVHMCIKETLWIIEAADELARATTLLLAQIHIREIRDKQIIPLSPFSNPSEFNREELISIYELLENSRNDADMTFSRFCKILKSNGILVPETMARYSKLIRVSIGVLMSTIGYGIVDGRISDVYRIWFLLDASSHLLNEANRLGHIYADDVYRHLGISIGQSVYINAGGNDIEPMCMFRPRLFID